MSLKPPPRIAAALLAAGSSRRFGAANKLLARVDGEALVRRVARRVIEAKPACVLVVTGHEAEAINAALAGLDLQFIHNPRHLDGLGGSLAVGIAGLSGSFDGALVCLGDMPDTEPALIARMFAAFAVSDARSIIVPVAADGRQGNPVLWPADLFPELAGLSGDEGAKRLIRAHQGRVVKIDAGEARTFQDIDTPEELAKYCGS